MTLHPAPRSGTDRTRRALRALGRALLLLLLACVLAQVLLLPFMPWVMRPGMVQYIVPWLLRPSTGFLSLTAVLWLLFTVPGALRALSGRRRGVDEESGPDPGEESARGHAVLGHERSASRISDREEQVEIRIPAGTFRHLGPAHRHQMARALGIPWRDELIHDHQDWAVACLEAAQARAATSRR